MNIEEKKIIRVCTICRKEYKDVQFIINKIPAQKFNICNECRETMTCLHEIQHSKLNKDLNEVIR